MKKWCLIFLVFPVFLTSCKKDNKCGYSEIAITATATEISYLQDYINTNSITAIQHSSGIFFHIDNPGTGYSPNICSNITVNYTGTLIPSGTLFDSNTTTSGVSFILGQLIVGWQKGLTILNIGGTITLYIPPSLGYGSTARTDNNGNVVIPANSYLKFTIHLLDVQ